MTNQTPACNVWGNINQRAQRTRILAEYAERINQQYHNNIREIKMYYAIVTTTTTTTLTLSGLGRFTDRHTQTVPTNYDTEEKAVEYLTSMGYRSFTLCKSEIVGEYAPEDRPVVKKVTPE